VGITDYAQHALGDVVYVDLPEVGEEFEQGDSFGSVESVKAASDLLMPISGTILEVNEALDEDSSSVNTLPYESWIIKIAIEDELELTALMSAKDYESYCEEA
jgi:glycine cleavage system H protein